MKTMIPNHPIVVVFFRARILYVHQHNNASNTNIRSAATKNAQAKSNQQLAFSLFIFIFIFTTFVSSNHLSLRLALINVIIGCRARFFQHSCHSPTRLDYKKQKYCFVHMIKNNDTSFQDASP